MPNSALIAAHHHLNFKQIKSKPESWGRVIESAIGAHLVNYSKKENYKTYYWRDGNYEVDFVLESGKKIIAIEVKSGKEGKLQGMHAFKKKMKPNKILLIGTQGIPVEDFLKINPASLFK